MVKGTTIVIWVLAILIIGGLGTYLFFNMYHPFKTPINEAYRTQIDRLSPDYLKNKQLACTDFNGDWVDSRTKVGCFQIGTDWESEWCTSTEGSIVEDICNGIQDSKWVCDQHNAGCYY